MISLNHAHAIPQAISIALGACFAAVLVFGSPTKAHAASTGCNALNGGGGDTVIPAGGSTMGTVTINETLDAGEKLVITITGNPNSVRIGTNPGNVLVSAQPGNLNLTITLAAGITGITISGGASAGANTVITLRCMSSTTAVDTPSSTERTPEETSDAVDNAGSQIDSGRLPTSPAALPTAGGGGSKFDDAFAGDRARIADINEEIGLIEEIDALEVKIETLVDTYAAQWLMYQKVSGGKGLFGDAAHAAIDTQDSPDITEDELKADYEATAQQLEDLAQQRDALQSQTSGRPQRALERERAELQEKIEQGQETLDPDLVETDVILLQPGVDSHSFAFETSTDALMQLAALRLDDSATGPAELPPLTIGGMPVNIWVRGRGTIFDRQKRAGSDGWSAHLLSGVAVRITDDLVLGGFGSYLTGESDQKATGTEVKSNQIGGGLYGRLRLTDSLSAGISASRESGEQDIKTPTATGSTDTRLWTVAGSLSGSWAVDPVVLTPALSVSYADSKRDAYTDSTGRLIPGSSSQDTTIGSALTVSRSFVYEDGWIRRATPRLNGTLNYFAREKDTLRLSATEVIDRENWGANVGAGVTLTTSGSSRLSFDAGVIGIGQDTLGFTGQLQLEIGF